MACFDGSFDMETMAPLILDGIPAAVTVVDAEGRIVYFNDCAARMLDRKPEYMGRDVRACHNPHSVGKIDAMLEAFKSGRREPYQWESRREGRVGRVTFAPIVRGGELAGGLHCVVLVEE